MDRLASDTKCHRVEYDRVFLKKAKSATYNALHRESQSDQLEDIDLPDINLQILKMLDSQVETTKDQVKE